MRVYSDPASGLHVNLLAGVEVPERFPAALAGVEAAEEAGEPVERLPCAPAPEEALRAVHEPRYLERVRELSATNNGYLAPDTSVNSHSWDAARLAAGAACSAVESALSGEPAFAVARPPGHHAGADYGMGFCLVNHAAVSAAHVRSLGAQRVAIFDWDVHHGNGTQDIFYAAGDVLYLSVHQSPFYPGTGAPSEVGTGPGRGLTANVALPARADENSYAAAFAGLFFPLLRAFAPDVIVVSAGYDAHAADLLGGMRLPTEAFGRFAATLTSLARELGAAPPAFVLEGGYDLGALGASVAATIAGVRQEPPGWEHAGESKPVEQSRRSLAPFWSGVL